MGLQTIEALNSSFDVVHIQHEYGLFPRDYEVLKLLGGSTRITLHTVLPGPHHGAFQRTVSDLRCAIAHTPEQLAFLGNGTLIPHGVHVHQQFAHPEIPLQYLVQGFLTPGKGVEAILGGWAHYQAGGRRDARLTIAGRADPAYLLQIEGLIMGLGISDTVDLKEGWIPKPDKLYEVAWAVLLSGATVSRPYLLSRSASGQAHTAIGYGCPVIARNQPIYRDGAQGLWDTPEDLGKWLHALQSWQLREELSGRAYALAKTRSWKSVAQRHLTCYEGL